MDYRMSELDLFLFNEGKLTEAYKHFGSHLIKDDLNQAGRKIYCLRTACKNSFGRRRFQLLGFPDERDGKNR